MSLPKFTSHMLSNQPDQTAYLLNKLAAGGGGGDGKLYNTTGQNTDGAMTQKATTNALGTKADAIAVGNALAGKVDKEVGKGLSTNDFTDADKSKLAGIETGAEVNVQSDWNQTDTDADDYIKNKPTIPSLYTLPPATTSTLGGIIAGNNLSVASDGTLSATIPAIYMHVINCHNTDSSSDVLWNATIFTSNDQAMTIPDIAAWLYTNGFTSMAKVYPTYGVRYSTVRYVATTSGGSTTQGQVIPAVASGLYAENSTEFKLKINYNNNDTYDSASTQTVEDIVLRII